MRHGGIPEHPDDVQERVGVAKRRDVEKSGRAGLRASGAPHVGKFHGGRHVLFRIEQSRQPVQPLVRDPGDPDVRLLLAAGARRLSGAGQELEEGGLSRGRESNEAGAQHGRSAHRSTPGRGPGTPRRRKDLRTTSSARRKSSVTL